MSRIWNIIERTGWKAATKFKVFLWVLCILFGGVGLLLWSIVRMWALQTLDWMVCFVGYPVMLSWVAVLLYTCNHSFHNGT